jgi:Domain of unknown function (DUF4864)
MVASPSMTQAEGDADMTYQLHTLLAHARRRLAPIGLALILCGFSAIALAASFTPADEKDVREVVQAQLAAFAADDAEKAFSYAAPNIRQSFASASHFMAMVRGSYAVVYRPASVAFLKLESLSAGSKNTEVVQRVQMTDANDTPWLAVYSLQRQKDKHWRITGCIVTSNTARMI